VQSGPWKIDARFNRAELIYRIESIAKMKDRISLSNRDALDFLKCGIPEWSDKTLMYLDPPYYKKGRDLTTISTFMRITNRLLNLSRKNSAISGG
jgi:DNA adenine methylase